MKLSRKGAPSARPTGSGRGVAPEESSRNRSVFFAGLVFALLGALAGHAGIATAQCESPSAQILLDQTIEVFRVGDFDPSDTHFHPGIFTLSICSDRVRNARLKLTVSSTSRGALAEGESDVFALAAGTITLTNQDLARSGGVYELRDFEVQPEGEELEDSVLGTGRLPEGEYCFEIDLLDGDDGTPIAPRTRACLLVTNPLDLELLRPGAPFGEPPPAAFDLLPQFQWASQARCWRLTIARAEPGDASGEDVMEHVPVYTTLLTLGEDECGAGDAETAQGGAGLITWSYPPSAEDLLADQTYCWQMTAVVETSGGTEEFQSEVFCFRRSTPGSHDAARVASLLEMLVRRIREHQGAPLDDGLQPTGEVWLNGQAVDPLALQEIVDGIVEGRIRIEELRLE